MKREGYWFCDQCPEYPCEACREGEERYQSQYALQKSPKGNHPGRGDGAVFAAAAREMELSGLREPISVHYGVCRDCGREIGSR